MYIKRHIEDAILLCAKDKGAVVVTGTRQVGKTTLIENLFPLIPKITFDDLPTRREANDSPSTFFNFRRPPLFIDEVQYVPDIFNYIKIEVDAHKRKGDFFLTGSQSYELMENVTESLAGRAGILELHGLSLRELFNTSWNTPFMPTFAYLSERNKHRQTKTNIWDCMHRGSMPELALNTTVDWDNFYSDYVKTYIERDVRKLTQVADADSFLRFMVVCAAMSGQLLNISSLAKDVGISNPTAARWLSILRTSGLIYLLQPYSNNAITRAVKTPKLHFLDIGLASYLTRWKTAETLSAGASRGPFFESFVVSEIIKSYTNAGIEPQLYFIRDGNRNEIDLIIFENNTLYPIEMKSTGEPKKDDFKNFKLLENIKNVHIGEGAVICTSNEIHQYNEKLYIVPIDFI